jgi:hypothetical protein
MGIEAFPKPLYTLFSIHSDVSGWQASFSIRKNIQTDNFRFVYSFMQFVDGNEKKGAYGKRFFE